VLKETLIGKILEHQTVKADPSLDFKMESPLEDDKPKELVLFPPKKAAIQKLKLLLFIIMNPLLLLQS
jgi:transcription termination factor Rho